MPVPDYQSIMLPLLQFYGDGKEHSLRETISVLAKRFDLTTEDLSERLPSGLQPVFDNRVGWARTYLKKAGLLYAPRRAYAQITPRGRQVLDQNPAKIDASFLMQFPEFVEFKTRSAQKDDQTGGQDDDQTPEEAIEAAYRRLREGLASDLLDAVKRQPPEFFEHLVIDLLVTMGYGGSRRDAAQAVGRSGDGGIDGTIKEDSLGLDVVYVQAKRWEACVGSPPVMSFAGALAGKKARKGVFITTSSFSQSAIEYARSIESKIVLIDGEMLAQLMIDYGIGVTTTESYQIKRVDSDYFPEE